MECSTLRCCKKSFGAYLQSLDSATRRFLPDHLAPGAKRGHRGDGGAARDGAQITEAAAPSVTIRYENTRCGTDVSQ